MSHNLPLGVTTNQLYEQANMIALTPLCRRFQATFRVQLPCHQVDRDKKATKRTKRIPADASSIRWQAFQNDCRPSIARRTRYLSSCHVAFAQYVSRCNFAVLTPICDSKQSYFTVWTKPLSWCRDLLALVRKLDTRGTATMVDLQGTRLHGCHQTCNGG